MEQGRQPQNKTQYNWIRQVSTPHHGSFVLANFNSFRNVTKILDNNPPFQLEYDQKICYFNMFFSPKQTTQSLKRRNDNLEMLNFQNSDEEPDDVYNRRKKKVADLINKQQQQLSVIQRIKDQDIGKYQAIIEFIKFFCLIKQRIAGTRTDYYSSKTFCALKNSNEAQLIQLTKVVNKMYNNIMIQTKNHSGHAHTTNSTSSQSNHTDERLIQFLIIPRFLISKQKINRLVRDQVLQKNFQFLVFHQCLGHYNNQANKKMPEQVQMIYVRQLLCKKNGRQKFKKICSINHGNKFFKNYPNVYYELYSKSLQYLKQLDNHIKKGKKFESIKKQLQKLPSDIDDVLMNSSFTESQSSNSIYNFKNFNQCLNKIENSQNQSQIKSQMKDQFGEFGEIVKNKQLPMKKRGMRKLMSMPLTQQKQEERPRGFSVRKSQTMQARTTQNIFVVPPQFHYQS